MKHLWFSAKELERKSMAKSLIEVLNRYALDVCLKKEWDLYRIVNIAYTSEWKVN